MASALPGQHLFGITTLKPAPTHKGAQSACGPIHPTKANANPTYWCTLLPVPVVGIARMDVQRAAQAARCGAIGVAVIGAITAAPSPEAAIAALRLAVYDLRRPARRVWRPASRPIRN